jgi:hypothetical protein
MNVLSSNLKAKIEARPTNTLLRREISNESEKEHIELIKSSDTKLDSVKVPEQFDGRKVWKGLLSPVRNQGSCGSCWAFASTSTLADRFNIQSMGLMNIKLSPAKVILCDVDGSFDIKHPEKEEENIALKQSNSNKKSACFGNTLADAWEYLYLTGTNTEECVPYNKKYGIYNNLDKLGSFSEPERMPTCVQVTGILGDMCSDFTYNGYNSEETGTPARFYRAIHYYAISGVEKDGGSDYNIKYNIFKWGPVSTSFAVYPNFYTFDSKNEIYEWDGMNEQIGGHAVEIVGWGIEGNKKYWIIKNSWGTEWGDNGYFRMIRGINNCELEENIITGIPDYFYPTSFNISEKGIIWAESRILKELRHAINVDTSITAGGIYPTTGYTRRVMTTMPWVYLGRPIELENIPNHDKWIAGIDANITNMMIKNQNNNFDYGYIFNLMSILIIIILLIVVIVYLVKRK